MTYGNHGRYLSNIWPISDAEEAKITTTNAARHRKARPKKLDGRTKEGRLLRDTRADLVAHCGGQPSATQKALIERAALLTLHVARLDREALAGGGFSEATARQYLAWSNSLGRTLASLGVGHEKPAPAAARPGLAAYLAKRKAEEARPG